MFLLQFHRQSLPTKFVFLPILLILIQTIDFVIFRDTLLYRPGLTGAVTTASGMVTTMASGTVLRSTRVPTPTNTSANIFMKDATSLISLLLVLVLINKVVLWLVCLTNVGTINLI